MRLLDLFCGAGGASRGYPMKAKNSIFFVDENDLNAYKAGERAFERGQPEINPYPADDRRNRFWQIGYESGEMITDVITERELYGKS